MFWNYLKVAYRNLLRHPLYAAINAVGLGIAIAFCVLAFLYVRHEWTYDAFHENADRIYRVYVENDRGRSIRPAHRPHWRRRWQRRIRIFASCELILTGNTDSFNTEVRR